MSNYGEQVNLLASLTDILSHLLLVHYGYPCFILLGTPKSSSFHLPLMKQMYSFLRTSEKNTFLLFFSVAVVFQACKWQFNIMHVLQDLKIDNYFVTGDHSISLKSARKICRAKPHLT